MFTFTPSYLLNSLILCPFGGMAPHTYAHLKRLARDAAKVGARDGTTYDDSWTARSFLSHHMQRIASAAVMEDAQMALHQI